MPENSPTVAEIYSDIEIRNSPKVTRAINEQAVFNSIDNILTVQREDRLFRFDGINLENLLFNVLVVERRDVQSVYAVIRTAILNGLARDPRVIVNPHDIRIEPDVNNRTVNVSFSFRIANLDGEVFSRNYEYTQVAEPWRPSA